MRKFTFMIFMSLFSIASFGQLAMEGFETWPPTDWGIYDNGVGTGTTTTWVQSPLGSPIQPPYEGDYAAYIAAQSVPSGTPEDWLVTPQFTAPANPQLRFYSRTVQSGPQGTVLKVMISTSSDPSSLADYTLLEEWTDDDFVSTDYTLVTVNLPADAVGQDVYVAFVRSGNNGDHWLVDNVSVVQQCLAPTNLTFSNPGLDSVELNWDANGATAWEIEIVPIDEVPTGVGVPYTGTLPYQATGLEASTVYKAYVRSVCDSEGNVSDWTNPLNFSTVALGATCAAPIEITSLPYSTTDNTAGYGDDYSGSPGASGCGTTSSYLNGDDVVYAYTAPADGVISIDATNLGNFAGAFVYESCDDIGVNCIAGGTGNGTNPISMPIINVTAGTTYYVVISTYAAPQSTPYTLTVQVVNCAPPTNLTATNIDDASADLSWDANSATSWEIAIQDNGAGIPAGAGTTVTTNVNFDATAKTDGTPFTPSTNYEYYVRADCGDGTFSAWAGPFAFTTTQIPGDLDYSDDFEAVSGWTLSNGTSTNKWIIGNAVNNGGTQSLYITNDDGVSNAYTNSSTTVVHAYRDIQMPATIDALTLSFDWRADGESTYDYLRVWLVPATFNPTQGTLINNTNGVQIGGNHNQNATFTTEEYYVNASAYAGQVMRLVFEWRNDGSGGTNPPAAVDNVNLEFVDCPIPTNLTAGSETLNGATFNWDGPTSVTPTFDYYVSEDNTAPDDTTTPTGNVSTEDVSLNNLTPSTMYHFWVRSNCGSGSTSLWVGPVTINTLQIPAQLDFSEDFEGTINWTLNNGTQTNKWIVGTATSNGSGSSLYITNDDGVTNAYTNDAESVVHAYRDIEIPAGAEDLYLTFDWKAEGESIYDYLRVWIVPVTYNPVTGTQIDGSNGDQIGGNYNQNTSWTSEAFVVPAADYEGTTIRLVFEWINDGIFGDNPPAAVDNVNLSLITCPAPDNVTADNLTETTADIAWEAPETIPFSYDYYVSTSDMAPDDDTTPTENVPDTNATATNLTPGEIYYVWVRSNCGAGDTSLWIGPAIFVLPQVPAQMDFEDDFDADETNWTLLNMGQPNVWTVGTAVSNSPDKSLYITNDGGVTNAYTANQGSTVHAFRDIEVPATIADAQLSFDWKSAGDTSENDYFRVWLVPVAFTPQPGTQITDADGLQLGDDYSQNPEWTTETQIFNATAYAGQTVRLVFEWRNNTFTEVQPPAAIDNVLFKVVTCPQPTDLIAEAVQGASYINLSWTPTGSETQWEVVVQAMGSGAPGDEPTTSVIVTDDPSYIANDIVSGEYYEFYVRAICGEDDSSLWSGPQLFSIFNPPGCANVEVFDPELDIILPGSEYIVCPDEDNCVPLSANYMLTGETTSYEIESIDYAPPFPFTGGTPVSVGTDDVWSPVVELPFEFCFFGEIYSEVIVGSNGVVSFDTTDAEGYCPYSFNQTIPNTGFPILNAIYGVYQDIDPNQDNDVANPDINYQVLGTYPCRALVVNFSEVAQFSSTCNNNPDVGAQTTQIVIYEISNVIEVYVGNRVPCTSWQNGAGVLGLQNADGTEAYVPTDRNTGAWTATEEAWRFTPNGDTNVVFEWLQDGVTYSDQKDITVCVTEPTTLTARATYTNCNGELLVKESDVTIRLAEEVVVDNLVDIGICTTGEIVTVDLNDAMVDFVAGLTNPENFTITFYETEEAAIAGGDDNLADEHETNTTETIYVRVQETGSECYYIGSFEIVISDNPPQFTLEGELDVCEGQSSTLTVEPINFDIADATITWTLDGADLPETGASINATEAGIYEVSVVVDCEATEAVTVIVHESPVADLLDNVTECDVYVLPALSDNNNYYTGPDGTGDMLAVGDEITTDQTIYIYAQVEGLECTDETSFIVDIVPTPALTIAAGCEDNLYILEVSLGEDYTEADVVIEWTDSTGAIVGTGTSVVAEEPGEYTVTVTPTGDVSCPAVLSETVDTVACMIPKGISPNGDTLNDNFDLTGFNVRKISIFNRYGKEVFTQGAYTNEWYGQDKKGNELPTGTYYYSIELGNGDSKTGWVYINREE
ncbi:fibronectin type III domain-containing protein [Flavobacterium sp. ST-75]|uniref:Fibronectin type III domain-containing protein n=1 Tax=Flavobacterium rhizophilum TaxID=3163296 RepID=A0ABW8YCA4_9FLAO